MDREYYGTDEGGGLGSPLATQSGTTWLIGAHVVGFVLAALGPDIVGACALIPKLVWSGQVWRLLSYAFITPLSHAWGLLWDMLFLWWFGREVESLYGTRNFVLNYLLGAVVGAVAALFVARATNSDAVVLFGASPAILGMLVTYTLWYPRRQIYFFGIFPIEMRILVLIYVGLDLLAFSRQGTIVVAAAARLAAAGWGAAVKLYDIRPGRWLGAWRGLTRRRPRLEIYHPEEDEEEMEKELDALLDKVRAGGLDSLTAEEKRRLQTYSERLKNRRRV